MIITSVTTTILGLLFLQFAVESVLRRINEAHIRQHRNSIPHGFEQFIDNETYQKSIDYTLEKSRFSCLARSLHLGLNAAILVFGIFPYLYGHFSNIFGTGIIGQALVFLSIQLILSMIFLPLNWWNQFHIEEKFGFNRSSKGIFFSDKIKGAMVSVVLGLPLLSVLILFFQSFPNSWWILGWLIMMGFQTLMVILYPYLILPLFNKLSPLQEGDLKEQILKIAHESQFPVTKIFTIDGSKRSSHSNAFFTGIGKFRHIVLYDTLIQQMSTEELAAVVAHEMGHYKKKHVLQHLLIEAFVSLVGFYTIYFLSQSNWFLPGFGFSNKTQLIPLILVFSIAIEPIMFWFEPLFNILSRKHEYQADQFSRQIIGHEEPLISSLRKLHKKNLSNLVPHPFYSAFYYSHPTLPERESALQHYDQ